MHVCLGKGGAYIDCMLGKVFEKDIYVPAYWGQYSTDKSIDAFLASVPMLEAF